MGRARLPRRYVRPAAPRSIRRQRVDGAFTYPRSLGHRPGAYSSSSQPLVFGIQLCGTYTTAQRGCQITDDIFDPEPSTAATAAARLSTSSFAKIDFK